MGVIQLSKRYTNRSLKNILCNSNELINDNQTLIKGEGSNFCRGPVSVCYGKICFAANYAREAWDKVNDETINSFFLKTDLTISLNCHRDIWQQWVFRAL